MLSERDAVFLFSTLEKFIPIDAPAKVYLRTNMKGKKCIRYTAVTNGKTWTVDFYTLGFLYCLVPPSTHQIINSVLSLISYLYRSLGLDYEQLIKTKRI